MAIGSQEPSYAEVSPSVSEQIQSTLKPSPVLEPKPDFDLEVIKPLAAKQPELAAERAAQEAAIAEANKPKVESPRVSVQTGGNVGGLLGAIRRCESTNNYQASNGTHFGAYQFDYQTWASIGGSGDPRNASPAEQDMRAQMLLDQRGTQPWLASQGCWG